MNDLIYDALMLGRNKLVAREEYLCSKGEKKSVDFRVSEKNINFSNVVNDTTGIIHLKLFNEGYAEIECYCECGFIDFEKKVITTDEFRDGQFEFLFNVDASKLHNRKNFARIIFRTPVCSTQTEIVIDNSVKIGYAKVNKKEIFAKLCRIYLNLRLGNLFQTEWQEQSLALLDGVSSGNVEDLYLMLYKANVLISKEEYTQASHIIEFVASQMRKMKKQEWDLVCYFFYISSLYEMDDIVTKDVTEQIKSIYSSHPSWKILWILFYMDAELNESPKEMYTMLESEFLLRGFNSPVMYYETVEILKENPELLSFQSELSLKALEFAAKEEFLSSGICVELADQIWDSEEKTLSNCNLRICINVLAKAYDTYKRNRILKSLCKAIICAGLKGREYHRFFRSAVDEFVETTNLYSYYIFTADTSDFIRLSQSVIGFLMGREYVLGEYKDYYFACLIKEKEKFFDLYDRSLGSIVRSACEAADYGKISRSLAVIYKDLMDSDLLPHDRYQRMLEILCTKEIVTDNKLVSSVLVFHKEFNDYKEYDLKDGRTLARVFMADAIILFKDLTGNIYNNIDYKITAFIAKYEYLDVCMKYAPVNRYMFAGDSFHMMKAIKKPKEILEFMHNNMGSGLLNSEYEQDILKDMIAYYSKSANDDETGDMLLSFLQFDLGSETESKLIEVMIARGKYEEALVRIRNKGTEGISDKNILALAKVIAAKEEPPEDEITRQIIAKAFTVCDFDEEIFNYMTEHYDGSLEMLLKVYAQAKAHGLPEEKTAEKVIRKMVQLKECPSQAPNIFAGYFYTGNDEKLKADFVAMTAEKYLFCRAEKLEYIFEYVEKYLYGKNIFSDTVTISYLIYKKDHLETGNRAVKMIEEQLRELVRKDIMLEEFKEYRRYFKLPAELTNIFVAEKITAVSEEDDDSPLTKMNMFGAAPSISYEIKRRDEQVKGFEAMREVAGGVYVKYFTLFFGEELTYTIDEKMSSHVCYNDLHIVKDDSRYCALDNMMRLKSMHEDDELKKAMTDYYVREKMVENLF